MSFCTRWNRLIEQYLKIKFIKVEDAKNNALMASFQILWIHLTDPMPRKIPAVFDNMGGQLNFHSVQFYKLWSC